MGKIESVVLVGQKSVICYIQMVVVALLSVDLVESVDLVSVDLVVNCICIRDWYHKFRSCINSVHKCTYLDPISLIRCTAALNLAAISGDI